MGTRIHVAEVVARFPRQVRPPGLAPVGRSDLHARTVVRLRPISAEEAVRRVREDRVHLEAELSSAGAGGSPRALVLRQEQDSIERLESDLVARRTRLWDALVAFADVAPSVRLARRGLDGLAHEFQELGFRFHASDWRVRAVLEGLEPGTEPRGEFFHALPEEGVAALLPLWEDRLEDPRGVLLGVHSRHATPVLVDRFAHPSHSSAIFGQTGSGKSYASALGWLRATWMRPELSVFVLDPLGGLAQVVRAMGGEVLHGTADELAINPLDPATTGGDSRAKVVRVGVMFRALFPSLTDEESAVLDSTLTGLYARGPTAVPLLSDLLAALEDRPHCPERLVALLTAAVRGSLRSLDRPTGVDLSAPRFAVDLSATTSTELPFFLTMLLDMVYGEIRRRPGPKLLVLDEAHYLARSPATAEFLDHLVRHVRHFQGGLELLSQDPEDFLREPAGRSVLRNLDMVLLLHLKDGGSPLEDLLDLRPGEVDFVRQAALPGDTGYSEGLLRVGELHLPLAILSSPEEDRFLREAFHREGRRVADPSGAAYPGT